MNIKGIVITGIIMAAYFNIFAEAVLFYNRRYMFPSFPKEVISLADNPPTKKEKRFYLIWIVFFMLVPLLVFGGIANAKLGITGFKELFTAGYIQWFIINIGDLFFLDICGILFFKDRIVIEGTEGAPIYSLKNWLIKYALPEHLLQWPLILIPLMSAASAGIAKLFLH